RRHTRFSRDWSSDVCSSDLADAQLARLAILVVEPAIEDAAAANQARAIVLQQVRRLPDRRMAFQVSGRCDSHALAADQGARDQVAVAGQVEYQPDIDLLLDDIELGVVQEQLDADLRMPCREFRHQRRDAVPADLQRRADAHVSTRAPGARAEFGLGGVELEQDRFGAFQQEAAFLGKREAARPALDQAYPQALFHRRQPAADHRKGALQAPGGFREAAGRGDAHEQPEVAKGVGHAPAFHFPEDYLPLSAPTRTR